MIFSMAHQVGVVGGSGYTGAELLRLLAGHPDLEVVIVTAEAHAGAAVAEVFPSLRSAYPGLRYELLEVGALDGVDVVFLGLPHGESQRVAPQLAGRVGHLVDLAAD